MRLFNDSAQHCIGNRRIREKVVPFFFGILAGDQQRQLRDC